MANPHRRCDCSSADPANAAKSGLKSAWISVCRENCRCSPARGFKRSIRRANTSPGPIADWQMALSPIIRVVITAIVSALRKRAIPSIHTSIFSQEQKMQIAFGCVHHKILHKNAFYATFPPLKYDITSQGNFGEACRFPKLAIKQLWRIA